MSKGNSYEGETTQGGVHRSACNKDFNPLTWAEQQMHDLGMRLWANEHHMSPAETRSVAKMLRAWALYEADRLDKTATGRECLLAREQVRLEQARKAEEARVAELEREYGPSSGSAL